MTKATTMSKVNAKLEEDTAPRPRSRRVEYSSLAEIESAAAETPQTFETMTAALTLRAIEKMVELGKVEDTDRRELLADGITVEVEFGENGHDHILEWALRGATLRVALRVARPGEVCTSCGEGAITKNIDPAVEAYIAHFVDAYAGLTGTRLAGALHSSIELISSLINATGMTFDEMREHHRSGNVEDWNAGVRAYEAAVGTLPAALAGARRPRGAEDEGARDK